MTDHPLNTTRNNRARVVQEAQTRTQITRADAVTIRVEAVELVIEELLRKLAAVDAIGEHLLTTLNTTMIVAARMAHDTRSIIDEVVEALTTLTVPVIIQPSNEMKLTNFTRRKSVRSKLRLKRSPLLNFKESMWCRSPEK